jgi:hypothetical protein
MEFAASGNQLGDIAARANLQGTGGEMVNAKLAMLQRQFI